MNIETALQQLATGELKTGALALLESLGFSSRRTEALPSNDAAGFARAFGHTFSKGAHEAEWKRVELLFQLTGDEVGGQLALGGDGFEPQRFQSFLFFAVELKEASYARGVLASIAREINKPFPAPVIVLFRHGNTVSMASLHRRENKIHSHRDVLDRVVLLKDIRCEKPHRAHLEILRDLQEAKTKAHDWDAFLKEWNRVLDIAALNKKFYRDLFNWFEAAKTVVAFPDAGEHANERGLIRLITRLIFTWFIKERGLVPDALFDAKQIGALLRESDGDSDSYYRAVLQNLFFATLNREMNDRDFAPNSGGPHKQKGEYGNTTLWRYEDEFRDAAAWKTLVANVPFLNGGLFECLDHCSREGEYIDGFSREPKHAARIPNRLFWGETFVADLSGVYDDKKQKAVSVIPLLNLLHSYKFTIDENTPLEEDVALDPELLGKVFENLLASYNPETRTTARKQTGSFYTPREIVNYMVEEALAAYLESATVGAWRAMPSEPMPESSGAAPSGMARHAPTDSSGAMLMDEGVLSTVEFRVPHEVRADTRALLSDSDARTASELGFAPHEIEALVGAIGRCTLLDPACGSGAFPMGALSKMVALLKKLDPQNELWLDSQLRAVDRALEATGAESSIIEDAKARVREAFANNDQNYARKLYLIERGLFGVDIQPVALQIAKLRFFIALIIDQKIIEDKPNRNIRALPNLETRFVCANTLISLPTQEQKTLADTTANKELDIAFEELARVRREHIAPKNRARKKELEKQDKRLRGEIEALMKEAGFGDSFVSPLVAWNPYDQNAVAPFFEPERMFGPELKDGFDIVIGNPPYVRHEGITELKPLVKNYDCFVGTADLYVYFFERALTLLKDGGVLSFICSNKFFRAGYGAKLRAYLLKNSQLRRLIDFGDAPVFTAIAYPHILVTQKIKAPDANQTFPALSWELGKPIENFLDVVASDSFAMPQKDLAGDGWRFEKAHTLDLLAKLRNNGTPLGEYVGGRFYRGVLTGFNEAFVIDEATRLYLIKADARSAELIKPFLRGRDVKRWRVNYANYYLIQIESSENKQHVWSNFKKTESDEAETVFAKSYPAIYEHLNQFRAELIKRFDKGRFFWELRACKYWNEFSENYIAWGNLATAPQFSLGTPEFVLSAPATFLVSDSLLLLGILNSTILRWFVAQNAAERAGGFLEYKPMYIAPFPIPTATPAEQQSIASRVELILSAKAADAAADIAVWEREIDELVADLYGLDEAEKELVGL